jgi:hypothetical protein
MATRKGLSAWLIISVGTAPIEPGTHNVVDVLDPRLSPDRVREIVEIHYHRNDTLRERIAWRLQKRAQPYPAESTKIDGVVWQGCITCGHNPVLVAQLVDNLRIEIGDDGRETPYYTVRKTVAQVARELHKTG